MIPNKRFPHCTCNEPPMEGCYHETRCLRPFLRITGAYFRANLGDIWKGFRSMFAGKLRW